MADDPLVRQLREVNEKLIVATVRAEYLAEAAADSEERFRSLVLASSSIVWHANASGEIAYEVEPWVAFTGLRLSDATSGSADWLDAVHPLDRDRVRNQWELAVKTATLYECEHRLLRKAGGYAWVASRAVPILRDGIAREWIGMMTDISKRIETELAREQFIAVLGHDLRSPLAAISISAEVLCNLHLESPYSLLADEIERTSRRMAALVSDVMDFARGRLGSGIPLVKLSCDLGAVCAEIVAEIGRVHPERALSFTTEGDLEGAWDAGRLAQVTTNLVANAVVHGRDPIAVTLVGSADEVVLRVTSHGPAIPAQLAAELFEPFTRASQAPARTGLGLGLYIVRQIVQAHAGSVDVVSNAQATTFTVRLPRGPASAPAS